MTPRDNFLKYSFSVNMPEIIDCPYQPGNLKISKKACLKRYKASSKTNFENSNRIDLFHYTVEQGLLRCRSCPIVQKIPDKLSESSFNRISN
jgi:hypothetical protein